MTIHHLFPTPDPDDGASGDPMERIVLERQPMAEALDAVRTVCADLGLATLLAELDGVDPVRVAAILEEVASTGRRAIATLQAVGANARARRAIS